MAAAVRVTGPCGTPVRCGPGLGSASAGGSSGSCVLNGSVTEGPYCLDGALLRKDITDGKGVVTFTTIYPGLYTPRATHIHVKVHTGTLTVGIDPDAENTGRGQRRRRLPAAHADG